MHLFPTKILGIDFHDYSAELAEIKGQGEEFYLEAYDRVNIPYGVIREGEIKNGEALKTVLTDLLKNANPKITETRNCAVMLPSSKTFTHLFTFPVNLTSAEIEKAIPYEAETVLPLSMEEVYWDFTVIEKDSASEPHASQYVLFVAILKRVANQYAQILEEVGLHPTLFSTQAESLRFALKEQLSKTKSSLVIDFGTLSTHYALFKGDKLRYFVSINQGGIELLRRLSKELQIPEGTLIEKYQKKEWEDSFKPITKAFIQEAYKRAQTILKESERNPRIGKTETIFLTGEYLEHEEFYSIANRCFLKKTVEIGDPKRGLQIDARKFIPLHRKQGGSIPYSIYFTNAIGIGLRGLALKWRGVNVLPNHLKESLSNRKTALAMVIVSVVMAGLSLFSGTFLFFKNQELSYERIRFEKQKAGIENTLYGTRYQEIRGQISEVNEKIAELSSIEKSLFSLAALIKEIEGLAPTGVTIHALTFNDHDLTLEVVGISQNREALLTFEKSIKTNVFVKEVISPISNYDQKNDISFSLGLVLEFSLLPPYGTPSAA